MNSIINDYMNMFGEMPGLLNTVNQNNKKYLKIVFNCILRGTPLTEADLENFGNDYDKKVKEKRFTSWQKN